MVDKKSHCSDVGHHNDLPREVDNNNPSIDVGQHNDMEVGCVVPLPTIVQGASATRKIGTIRGWIAQYMLIAIDGVEFKGYYV